MCQVMKHLNRSRYEHVFNNLSPKYFQHFFNSFEKKLQCLTIEFLFLGRFNCNPYWAECVRAREWGISITPSIIFIVVGGVGSPFSPL